MDRPVVGLLALGVVLVTVVLVTGTREQRRGTTAPVADPPPLADAPPVSEEMAALAPAMPVEAPLETEPTSVPETSPPSQREAAPSTLADELARAHWVEGRVVFPASTPSDEEVFVVARGKEFSDGQHQRARVEPDGHFRVAFAESAKTGWIVLEARYLYLEANVRWKRDESPGEPLVLAPRLGARITGRVVLPPSIDPGSLGGAVKLDEVQRTGSGSFTSQHAQRAVGRDLVFEFGGLPASSAYRVVYEGAELVGSAAETDVEAGRTAEIEIVLERGCVLAGRVVDESGAGVGGIKVMANVDGAARIGNRFDESDPDGAFRIAGLPGGKASLVLQAKGYAGTRHGLGLLETGDVREGLELVLRRGNSIAGRVQWPDGTPAEAELQAVFEGSWNSSDPPYLRNTRATSSADGTFVVTGLDEGPYTIKATAKREREPSGKPVKLSATAEHVAVGTIDLVLVLAEGHELEGRVVDDLGAPVPSCIVMARRVSQRAPSWIDNQDSLQQRVENESGTFHLYGFSPGDWELTMSGEGYGNSEPVRVSIPAEGPVLVTLPREALVRGLVLDPAGIAVSDARVTAEESMFEVRFSDSNASTDERGAFVLAGLSGTVSVTASADGWAPSERLVLELAPGEVRTDVVLTLAQGCRITGEVRDRSGDAVANVDVNVSSWYSDYYGTVPADADGRFEFTGVPAGDNSISVRMPGGLQVDERVTLTPGGSVHVVIAPKSRAVRLHGRVVLGEQPLAGASVYVHREDGSGGASAQCDDAGRYEVELDGAGMYQLMVSRGAGGTRLNATVEVPEVAEFAFDIVRGLGRISGSVRDENGRPLEGVEVEADPPRPGEDFGASAKASSGQDGRYELTVPAATYVVKAGGDSWRREAGPAYVEARVDGVVVAEDGAVRGIDLVLVQGGILSGVVRSPEALRWSMLSIAPADGSAPARYLAGTDENGRFHVEGVARGSWLVAAATDSMLSSWERVEIETGAESAVELELSPATWLLVRPRSADGVAVAAVIRVTVPDCPTYEARQNEAELEYWIGPFHPGTYRVRAARAGRVTEHTVEIAGGQERMELELVVE